MKRRRHSTPLVTPSLLVWLSFTLLLFSGCTDKPEAAPNDLAADTGTSIGSCSLGVSSDAANEDAIEAVLNAEGESVVAQDIDTLMRLWAEDGKVSDAKNTPDNADDDQNWEGRDAIRHRYVRTVFPGAPDTAEHPDLRITIDGDVAIVTGTTQIGDEVSPAGDRWELSSVDGCWVIQSLTYNLEASP
jgi:ketosteroid isomerase-like protein